MLKQPQRIGTFLTFALGLALVAPSVSAEMYSWRTEDGGIAYTDDRDQIPARYATQATRVRQGSLASYKRFTPKDDVAQESYAARLRERLDHLRQVNADVPAPRAMARSVAANPGRTISVATGNASAPEIQVPFGEDAGPVIVERVNAKQAGDFRTRRVTVIRQGGKTVAVVKGSPRHHNPATDIYDEDALDNGEF